jgi:hypothetical protein
MGGAIHITLLIILYSLLAASPPLLHKDGKEDSSSAANIKVFHFQAHWRHILP